MENAQALLLEQSNHRLQDVSPDTNKSTAGSQDDFAYFKEYGQVNLHVNFVDGTQDGDILFRDSWYLTSGIHTQSDGFVSKATTDSDPYIPNGSYLEEASDPGGAFTHQTYDPDDNILPYYSERVPWILTASQKQLKHEPPTQDVAIGDWVCYGFFGENEGDAVVTWDPYHYNATDYFTRAINFQDLGVTVNAEYTGHRSSVNFRPPTRKNSQRKVARENGPDGFVDNDSNFAIYHGVYESQGKVFYTSSTDMGSTWLPEQLVSDYYAESAGFPSIATTYYGWTEPDRDSYGTIDDETNVVYVAYVEDGELVLKSKPKIYSGPDKQEWTEIDRIAVTGTCHPVVACPTTSAGAQNAGEDRSCILLWEQGKTLKYSVYYNDNPVSGHHNAVLVNSSFDIKYPSITCAYGRSQYSAEAGYQLCWNRNGYFYTKTINMNLPQSSLTLGQNNFVRIPLHLQIKSDAAPSQDMQTAVYEATNRTAPVVTRFPNRTPISNPTSLNGRSYMPVSSPYPYGTTIGQLNPPRKVIVSYPFGYTPTWVELTTNSTASELNPVIGRIADDYSKASFVWRGLEVISMNATGGNHDVVRIDRRVTPSIWTTNGQSGFDANIAILGESVAVDFNSSLGSNPFDYVINAEHFSKTSTISYPNMWQAYVFNDDSAFAKYGIIMPNLYSDSGERTYLTWKPLPDSVIEVSSSPGISDYIRTDTFTVSANQALEYGTEMFIYNPDEVDMGFAFSLNFYDASTDNLLFSDEILAEDLPADSAWYVLTRLNLRDIEGETVYITMSIVDSSSGWTTAASDKVICYDLGMQKPGNEQTIPSDITLTNFPNPFNPSTEITYGIPEETHVKLAVYDNLGREVKVLANGWKAAGTYTVTFDAADLPSGMYLYRIETAKGSVSKKMMLMK